jgi:hypothetical protein
VWRGRVDLRELARIGHWLGCSETLHASGDADPEQAQFGMLTQQMLDHRPGRNSLLGAPVTEVIGAQHGVARELQSTGEPVADHGRPQVPDMHLLGDVRR